MSDFDELRDGLNKLATLTAVRRRGDIPKALVEDPLRRLLAPAIPLGLSIAKGFRKGASSAPDEDLDITIDLDRGGIGAHVHLDVDQSPVMVHLEVAWLSAWRPGKFRADLAGVQRTVDDARRRKKKTFTAIVLLGPFAASADVIGAVLHKFYHAQDIRRWNCPGLGLVYPFVDLVVAPAVALRKDHVSMLPMDQEAQFAVPTVAKFPIPSDAVEGDLQPLQIARMQLKNYLEKCMGKKPLSDRAWTPYEDLVALGAAPTVDDGNAFLGVPCFYVLRDGAPPVLFDIPPHPLVYAATGKDCGKSNPVPYRVVGHFVPSTRRAPNAP